MIDWTKMIGQVVRFGEYGNGELTRYDEIHTKGNVARTWRSKPKCWCTVIEPTLLPEWKPKDGEWVTSGHAYRDRPVCVHKWVGDPKNCSGYRPLTDEEKVDICGGIDEIERLFDTLRHR